MLKPSFRVIFAFYILLLVSAAAPAQKQTLIQKTAWNPCQPQLGESIDRKIDRTAACYGIPARLFRSLIWAESANRPKAVSYKGAACFTQLMPATARRYGLRVDSSIDERFNNDKCLNAGARYLSDLLRWFKGDMRLALAGYNAGEGAVFKFGWRIPPYRETSQYVEKILYVFSGQRGHSVTAAYNPSLASLWANSLYLKRYLPLRPAQSFSPVERVNLPAAKSENVAALEITPDLPDSAKENKPIIQKTTRVQISEIKPRLKTTSSFFWRSAETTVNPEK